ncbi:MAG: transglutaminase domain-containing protein [Vulcanisaeta sp.]
MNQLIMLLLLSIAVIKAQQAVSATQSIAMNASLNYIGSAYSLTVYELSYTNMSGYVITPQGIYEGSFAGILRLGNFVYVGFYRGIITKSHFLGSFTPIIGYEQVSIPTELSFSNSTNFIAIVKSGIPVVLRYLVFNVYVNGTVANTLPLITVNESTVLTIYFSNGSDCSSYRVNATFITPTQVVPIPVIINTQPPITYFVSNVTITSTYPPTELMLLEPGDIVVAETPISSASYVMYVCRRQGTSFNNYNPLYVIEYLGPVNTQFIEEAQKLLGTSGGNALQVIDEVFQGLVSGRYRLINYSVGPENLLKNGEGSIIDFVTAAMYILRARNIPSRVAFGFYGTYSNGQYMYTSSTGVLWDEAYTDGGWVMFMPVPFYGKPTLSPTYGDVLYSVVVGLVLAIPWLIGYVIYVMISHVKMR